MRIAALMAAAMLAAPMARAQLVTVPGTCYVQVAGAGGVTGFGGKVGDGGVVTMPDPSGTGLSFTLAGATPIKWTLLGDLSFDAAITPPTPPVASAGAVTSVKIMSYNKNLRLPSELGTPSTLARSKGRVTIEYTIAPCNNKMSFDIYKVWGNPAVPFTPDPKYAPPIVGPNCWGTTGLITFSVDQVSSDNALDAIGFDQYYWRITNGAGANIPPALAYTSADLSSTTIIQGGTGWSPWLNAGGPYTIQVCYGRANPWDGGTALGQATTGVTCVTKSIGSPLPSQPALTISPNCPAWSTNSFTASVNSSGYACTWMTDNPLWTLTPSGPNNQTVTVTNAGPNPGTLILTMQGNCGQVVYNYPVYRSLTNISPTISSGCVAPGSTFTVSLPGNAQNNCTNWAISPAPSPAWGYTQNATGSVRTYTIPAGTCAAQYSITATGCNCSGSSIAVQVNVKPATPVLSGPACVPYNAGSPAQVYNGTAVCGATSYTWGNSLGMTGSSTTGSISYTPAGTTGGQVTVVANGTGGCASDPAAINVNRTPPVPSVTWPCISVGVPGTTTFTVANAIPGVNYTWSFPAGLGSFAAGAAATKTVNTLGNPGTYNCSVVANNTAAPFCGPVTYNFPVTVAYTTSVAAVNQPGYSTVVATPGQASYQLWNCNTNATVGVPQAGNTFNLTNTGTGSYSVNITTLAGCTERPACVATNYSAMAPGAGDPEQQAANTLADAQNGFVIHPNPNAGAFTVSLLREVKKGMLTLYDAKGQQVDGPLRIAMGDNPVHVEKLVPGTYFVQLDLDGKVEIRSVVITTR